MENKKQMNKKTGETKSAQAQKNKMTLYMHRYDLHLILGVEFLK